MDGFSDPELELYASKLLGSKNFEILVRLSA